MRVSDERLVKIEQGWYPIADEEFDDILHDLREARVALREARRSLTHQYHIEGTWREVEVHDEHCALCIINKALAATEEKP